MVSSKEVAETLRSLPNKSSCGSDEISYRLMKQAGPAHVGPLVCSPVQPVTFITTGS